MARPRVLFVEDEFLIRLTVSQAMADAGFDVAEAATADEALLMLESGQAFTLLLTDLQLPGVLDGLSLVDRARRLDPGLPVIYMTGRPDALPEMLDPARDKVIAKPYAPSALCAAAHSMLRA